MFNMVFSITREGKWCIVKKQPKKLKYKWNKLLRMWGIIFQNKLNKNNFSNITLHCLVFHYKFLSGFRKSFNPYHGKAYLRDRLLCHETNSRVACIQKRDFTCVTFQGKHGEKLITKGKCHKKLETVDVLSLRKVWLLSKMLCRLVSCRNKLLRHLRFD